jgi:pSer/pThr/pTyr-binding forkhead associated (FHA) protein
MAANMNMTVNVSLCGSIPRSQMNFCSKKQLREVPPTSSDPPFLNSNCLSTSSVGTSSMRLCLPRQVSTQSLNIPAPPPIIEPPTWAVPARGDARLEPVCESFNLQSPVDLTKQAVFRIGRSQNSDVQLLHCTSSRRHALLFHHPNRSCYVVDCGSAHGTYVNGVRVKTVVQNTTNGSSPTGIILPHRVKKGSLIRFGGPGAPSFVLKSFSVRLDSLVNSLEETNQMNVCSGQTEPSLQPICLSSTIKKHPSKQTSGSLDALVKLNTRINAIGGSARTLAFENGHESSSLTSAHFYAQLQPHQLQSSNKISYLKKRSAAVSFDEDFEIERPSYKKMKIIPTNYNNNQSDIAIVSPSRQKPTLQFDFRDIDRPVVSPTPLEEDERITNHNVGGKSAKGILTTPLSIPSTKRKTHRVIFDDKPPEVFYPASVTPDSED